ncbi:MAG: hypothetical protein G01um101491_455 [Parcubacteria group bacterium Gr01-1014_91]|nr:MAG: hypothetical protein G01um101491_455 [Parcubacteria group bacterium Gr01-1014_91]
MQTAAMNREARRAEKRAQYEAQVRTLAAQHHQKRKPEVPAKPSPKQETVKLKDGTKFVLIFSLPRRKVPEGLQVLKQTGGAIGYTPEPQEVPQDVRFGKASIDLDGLMQRVSVDVINVCQGERDFCRVYVNCTVGIVTKSQGFGPWTGDYERFVRKNVEQVWGRAIVKRADDKTSMELRTGIRLASRPTP